MCNMTAEELFELFVRTAEKLMYDEELMPEIPI